MPFFPFHALRAAIDKYTEYGESSIPDRWLERLEWRNELRELADILIGL